MPFLARITLSEIQAFDYYQILALHRNDDRRELDASMLGGGQQVKLSTRYALLASTLLALAPATSLAGPPDPQAPAPLPPPPAPKGEKGDKAPPAPAAPKGDKAPGDKEKPPPAPFVAPLGGPQSPPRIWPNYDGRPPADTTAGEALLWAPRIVFFPLYVVTEYVLRRPLGFLTVEAEQGKWAEVLKDVFTFGPHNNIGVVPTALLDFGFRPSVGVYAFYDDFLVKDNALGVHAAFGGTDWLRLTVADRIPAGKNAYLKIRGEAARKPDFVFYGIGPNSVRPNRSRYGADWLDGSATYHADLAHGFSAETYLGVKTISFYDKRCCHDLSLRATAARGAFAVPADYDTGYTGFRAGGNLAFDSRRPRPEPGSGVRIEGTAEYGTDLRAPPFSSWVKYGGSVGGFVDITGQNHVLSLSLTTRFVDPLQDEEVPFTELVSLGGVHQMSGFYEGRLRGRSAAVATLEYRYPIWAFLDGSAQVAMGNVFNEHLDGFSGKNMRLSFDFGIRAAGDRDHSFSVLVGAGTETFGQGTHLNEARLLLGATQSF